MKGQPKKSELERMVLAKALLASGLRLCKTRDAFDFSRGILNLQDAVEIGLGATASRLGVQLKKKITFADYFTEINKALSKIGRDALPFERDLMLLNEARVKVKHFGLLQEPDDHEQAVGSANQFIEYLSRTFFAVELNELSLVQSIKNERVRAWVEKAEKALASKDPKSCVESLARARYELLQFRFMIGPFMRIFVPQPEKPIDWEKFEHGKVEIWLLEHGIDTKQFFRFNSLLPEAGWNDAVKLLVLWWEGDYCHEVNWTEENLRWALNFFIDMAIKVEREGDYPNLVSDVEAFDYTITAKADTAVVNYPKGGSYEQRMKLRGGVQVPQKEILALGAGKALVGHVNQDKEEREWIAVMSPALAADGKFGFGYVKASEVVITRALKGAA